MFSSTLARRALVLLLLVPALSLLVAACGDDDSGSDGGSSSTTKVDSASSSVADEVAARNDSYDAAPTEKLDPSKTYVVHLETSKGDFDITVDPKAAPIAAANFVFLVKEGFYDGITFHRVIDGFMVQAGDPLGDGTGGPGYELKDDPVKGSYKRGTVAMANAGPDTGGSQFFIVQGTTVDETLPKDYVIFGSVDEAGMKVVDTIAGVDVEPGPSGEPSKPVDPITIDKATLQES